MQKKVLALAVAGALGAPVAAVAQTSTVQIFGTMYIEYGRIDQGRGSTPPAAGGAAGTGVAPFNERVNVDMLQSPGTEIGFKGEEKLGGGLSAWFQCASTADIRGQSPEGFCSRNSALGLKGGFGNVFIGRWDSPFKRVAGPTRIGSNETGVFGSAFLVMAGSTSTLDGSARATFLRRQANMINYDSPNFGGFQVLAGFSSINGATANTNGVTATKPRILSLGAQYSAGPLYISGGYEKHKDFGGAGGANSDDGWHVGAAYTWGPVRFGGHYTRQEIENSATTESKIRAFHMGVDWRIVGPHGLRAAYSKVRDIKGNSAGAIGAAGTVGSSSTRPFAINGGLTGETGADLMQIRYVYTFSKRTEFNFGYVRLDNDARAFYAIGGVSAPAVGENQDAFAISVRHTF